MHTFFINTSDRDFMTDREIMDIEITNRELLLLNYSLKEWQDSKKGYVACADKISELIDNHKDINNDFNLVIYVDLTAIGLYNSIEPGIDNHLKREACLFALYSVIKHYIDDTLIKRLNDFARIPVETVIIFEENEKPEDHLNLNIESHRRILEEYIAKVTGFPDKAVFGKLLCETYPEIAEKIDDISSVKDENEKYQLKLDISITDELAEGFMDKLDSEFGFRSDYLKFYIKRMIANWIDTHEKEKIRSDFLMNIYEGARNNKYISCTSFVTNNVAASRNMTENLKRKLRIYIYLVEGIKTGTFLTEGKAKAVCEPDRSMWLELNEYFVEKKRIYKSKYEDTLRLQESYSSLGLAPVLMAFDNEKFAINEHGERSESGISEKRLFSKEELAEFDYDGNNYAVKINSRPDVKPSEYIKAAKDIKNYHKDYLHLLQKHIETVLSDYAQYGDDRKPPVLKKRVVNMDGAVTDKTGTKYNYQEEGGRTEERKNVVVERTADTSYKTAQSLYFEFCAANEVEVTNIDKQYNWLVKKIKEIDESLRKLKMAGIGGLCVVLAAYIPYILIEWHSVTLNFGTFFTALCSLAMPVVLFGVSLAAVAARQKRRFREVWDEFWSANLRALNDNKAAARHYDRLLSFYIPMLRYVYEYYQDVKFKKECESIAETKIAHHLEMLRKRIEMTDDIIDKLQLGDEAHNYIMPLSDYDIEYHRAYCSGEKNEELYSIIDSKMLDIVKEGGEK